MTKIHNKIVKEIIEKYKNNPKVIAINIMGSTSRGEEKPNSDVDIEIVTNGKERKFKWERKEKYGIRIDLIISSKGQILYQIKNYPFFLLQKDKKCLYDSTGFMKKIIKIDQEYAKNHPKIRKFWKDKFNKMRKDKKKGKKKERLRSIFDETEILFSKSKKVTRDWFRN